MEVHVHGDQARLFASLSLLGLLTLAVASPALIDSSVLPLTNVEGKLVCPWPWWRHLLGVVSLFVCRGMREALVSFHGRGSLRVCAVLVMGSHSLRCNYGISCG